MVAGIALLAVGLVAGVAALIDYNSETSKLNRELEEAKKQAEGAAETVQELTDS